jgi:glycosyltransferase involved in cell wall biosynthesis
LGQFLQSRKILKNHNWVSIPPFVSALRIEDSCLAKRNLGYEHNEIVVAWMGRFTPVKQPDKFVEISEKIPQVSFLMAGAGDPLKLRGLDNIKFLDWSDPAKILSCADVMINTSVSEGLSFTLIEAQQCGVPIVCFDVGGNSEIVVHGITGFLVNSIEEMIQRIRELTSNSDLLKSFSSAARRISSEKFNQENFINEHIRVYRLILTS